MRGGAVLDVQNARRISDISFSIDKDLSIKAGNRTFSVFLRKTEVSGINLSEFLSENDAENFKHFLSNFNPEVSNESASFVAKLRARLYLITCIFTVIKAGDNLFEVSIEELSYSRQILDKALLESREYSTLLQNFDAYYFIYECEKFTVKNTKDLNTIFVGNCDEFKEFFENFFHINKMYTQESKQLIAMLANIRNLETGKYYNFLQTDKKMLTVHTLRASTRKKTIVVGYVNFGQKIAPAENAYVESHDGLTGLYNKKAITEIAIKKINGQKVPCSMIIIDVDHFKGCNDTFGHNFGDRVLTTVANCIKDAIGTKGIAGRIGGDEFLVLLDLTEEDDIRNITRNIRAGIQWNITSIEPGSTVTCSMGVARFPLNTKDYDSLFNLADKCLYIAKNKGRNCYIIYKPELHDYVFIQNRQNENKIASGQLYNEAADDVFEILKAIHEKKSKNELQQILQKLVDYLGISTIMVYDSTHKLYCSAGRTEKNFREKALKQENYFSFFNKFDYLHLDNTNVLDSVSQEKYVFYQENCISSTLEVLCNKKTLICFDVFKPAKTFPKERIIFMLVVARLLVSSFNID